jgi:hypothetical protein
VEFAATGRLWHLYGGASLDELAEVIGPAGAGGRVHHKRRWPRWFGYHDVQLCVCRCRRIEMIIVPAWHRPCEVPGARPGVSHVVPAMPYGQIVAAIESAGCAWEPEDYPGLASQCTVLTRPAGGRVGFVFVTETGRGLPLPEPVLNKIVATPEPHVCPPVAPGTPDDGYGA